MSKQRFSWTDPELCHYDHDITKSWFVYFDFTDHLTSTTVRKQFRGYINREKKNDQRIRLGNALKTYWRQELERGWNPFVDDDCQKLPMHYSVREAFERILDIKLSTLGKRARETYTYVVKTFLTRLQASKLDTILMKDFNYSMASDYMDYLITERNFAGRTHNDHLIVLKTFINAMMEREWILKNPFKKIKKKETTIGRNHAYSEEEREQLKRFLYQNDRQMFYLSQIMYYCFIRRSEMLGLRVCDFDLENNTITIPANVSKNKSQESVVIPVGLEPVLREMKLSQYFKDDFVFGHLLQPSAHRYKNENHVSTRHNKYLQQLGLEKVKGLYSWKHTGVCVAYYATNKDVYAIMRQLRHRDLNTTMIYLKSLGLVQNDVFRNAMVA